MDYPKSTPGIGLVDGRFVDENPATGQPGSLIPAAWANALMAELLGVIQAAGMAPDEADNAQLVKGIRLLQQGVVGGYAVDSGAANAYVAAYTPAVSELKDGMVLRFKATHSNTGASTFAPNGLSPKPVLNLKGSPLGAADIASGAVVWLQYNATLASWVSVLTMGLGAASDSAAGVVELATSAEVRGLVDNSRAVTPSSLKALIAQIAPAVASHSNLKLSASGTSSTVSVSADALVALDADGIPSAMKAVAVAINSAAIGANGLDVGVLAASTWYSVWVIWNGATSAGLLSLSSTAPALPAGYTHKARVGWIRTDATANKYPLSFIQFGRKVFYKPAAGTNLLALPIMASGAQGNVTTPAWAAVAVSGFVPPTAPAIEVSVGGTFVNNVAYRIMVAPNNGYGALSSASNPPPLADHNINQTAAANGRRIRGLMALESTNIYMASDPGSGTTELVCLGWEDNL